MNSKEISKEKYHNLLEDCERPCKRKYCFYRMYLESQHPSIFIIIQVKLMEKMKYIWETESNQDLGWQKCTMKWNDDGYAEAYRKAFEDFPEDSEDIELIFLKTIEEHKKLRSKEQ